jgi:hypothetical protein
MNCPNEYSEREDMRVGWKYRGIEMGKDGSRGCGLYSDFCNGSTCES